MRNRQMMEKEYPIKVYEVGLGEVENFKADKEFSLKCIKLANEGHRIEMKVTDIRTYGNVVGHRIKFFCKDKIFVPIKKEG